MNEQGIGQLIRTVRYWPEVDYGHYWIILPSAVGEDVQPDFDHPHLAQFWRTGAVCYSLAQSHTPSVTLEEWTTESPQWGQAEVLEGRVKHSGQGVIVSGPEGRDYPPVFRLTRRGAYHTRVAARGRADALWAAADGRTIDAGAEAWLIRFWADVDDA